MTISGSLSKNIGSKQDRLKETTEFTQHELKLHDRLCKVEEAKRYYEEFDEEGHDDDDCVSTVSSCVGSVGGMGELGVEEEDIVGAENEETN